ncbi:MAG: serine/threonine protein kinase [Myxococcaceae bacterium]|nr:serine/threonine protein kinase [Myxococcaceae bacterium]
MAEVFLADAIDVDGNQVEVALKLMKKGMNAEAFHDEADLMGLLDHPNLVGRYEVGEAFGRPFISMEYLIGGDLRQVMDAHRRLMRDFPVAMGVHVCIEVLKGLAYFHRAKTKSGAEMHLVHSDVNPSNVFFSGDGEVKLGDFGVATSSRGNIGPGEGVAAGKLSYLSPEQTRGETLGPQSDVFAVGVMLHEMVVGFHPFQKEGASQDQVMAAIRAGKLQIPDYVDKPLAAIIARALAPDTKNRYATSGQLAGALTAFSMDEGLQQGPVKVQEWLHSVLEIVG